MKQLLFAALLCLFAVTTKAQTGYNYTGCAYTVQQICVDPLTCARTPGPIATVPPGPPTPLPFAPCPAGFDVVYVVCWVVCPGICTIASVTPPSPCSPWPSVVPLAGCAACPPATVSTNPMGDVKVYWDRLVEKAWTNFITKLFDHEKTTLRSRTRLIRFCSRSTNRV